MQPLPEQKVSTSTHTVFIYPWKRCQADGWQEVIFRGILAIELSFLHLCSGIQEMLPRLTATIRGIGDPLVAAYARAYLCRVNTRPSPPSVLTLYSVLESRNKVSSSGFTGCFMLLTPCGDVHVREPLLFSPGGHGSGPTAEGQPEP